MTKKCRIITKGFDKDWIECATHKIMYNPQLWHGKKKFCPEQCTCFTCKTLKELLNSIHWDKRSVANSKSLEALNKIFTAWGYNTG